MNISPGHPLKRNDNLDHDRELAISIGGTGSIAFGHSLKYLINRLWLDFAGATGRFYSRAEFLIADGIFANLILLAFFARSIALPYENNPDMSWSGFWRSISYQIKRALDLIGSFLGLILLIPLFTIIAILIKLDSPGPVFYTQIRVGQNRRKFSRRRSSCFPESNRRESDRRGAAGFGKPFTVIKFRTMIDNAEKKCGPIWATKNDPRITRVGSFLRKTRFDEFPQLINVLRGEMSLIGPRPERPVFVGDLSRQVNNYRQRLDVKPGITGLAQVENGYDCSVESVQNKIDYDLLYINRWSLWQDIKILLKTVVVVITGKGAF